jgi:hypothetical protein
LPLKKLSPRLGWFLKAACVNAGCAVDGRSRRWWFVWIGVVGEGVAVFKVETIKPETVINLLGTGWEVVRIGFGAENCRSVLMRENGVRERELVPFGEFNVIFGGEVKMHPRVGSGVPPDVLLSPHQPNGDAGASKSIKVPSPIRVVGIQECTWAHPWGKVADDGLFEELQPDAGQRMFKAEEVECVVEAVVLVLRQPKGKDERGEGREHGKRCQSLLGTPKRECVGAMGNLVAIFVRPTRVDKGWERGALGVCSVEGIHYVEEGSLKVCPTRRYGIVEHVRFPFASDRTNGVCEVLGGDRKDGEQRTLVDWLPWVEGHPDIVVSEEARFREILHPRRFRVRDDSRR